MKTVYVKDLNAHLLCPLCDGYFRDAHTVAECLHTFCKTCLYTDFEKRQIREKCCPTCNVRLLTSYYQLAFIFSSFVPLLFSSVLSHSSSMAYHLRPCPPSLNQSLPSSLTIVAINHQTIGHYRSEPRTQGDLRPQPAGHRRQTLPTLPPAGTTNILASALRLRLLNALSLTYHIYRIVSFSCRLILSCHIMSSVIFLRNA